MIYGGKGEIAIDRLHSIGTIRATMITIDHEQYLENIKSGGIATGVRLIVPRDACPVCQHYEGGYKFDDPSRPIPDLPLEGCSCISGCRATYSPILDRKGP